MKTNFVRWAGAVLFGCAMFIIPACESDEPMGKGEVEFQITDAPSDDASIEGVFVTVADIKVDGHSISGFTRQTIDLKAYQEGNTLVLGATELNARTYNNLTLVLDADRDASGNSPGCYVLTTDAVKYKLKESGMLNVTLNKNWNVAANTKSTVIMDFDLRKSIRAVADPAVRYSFVSDANLRAAIRVMNENKAGAISGSYSEETGIDADKIIVYAYKKGTFNASTETVVQGDDEILFKNAVASAEVKGLITKTFTLAFLEEGEYDLHFAAYNEDAGTSRFVFESMLESETSVNGSVMDFLTIEGGAEIVITTVITGSI